MLAVCLVLLPLACGEEVADNRKGQPTGDGRMRAIVAGDGKQTRISLHDGSLLTVFRIDWSDGDKATVDWKCNPERNSGTVITSWKRGDTGFTQTVLTSEADDLIVVHLLADKPGDLGFSVRVDGAEVKGRRELRAEGRLANGNRFGVRAWVWPMESEVEPSDHAITVMGEGEALILIAAATDDPDDKRLASLPDRMKAFGFGVEPHPDVHELWTRLHDRHVAAHREFLKR